jgi:hypothetical protein
VPFRMDGEFSFGQYNRKVNMNLSFGAGNQAEQRGSPNGQKPSYGYLKSSVESRCGAVVVGSGCLLPPLSSGGAQVPSP